jgi:uncharacterized protein with von Willebrand factor type A (vWA) domain
MSDSILFQLFRQLRQQKFSLGASDYLLVLEAVRSGLGLEDIEQFKRLLKLLWAKSLEEQKLLDLEFDRWMKPHLSPAAKYSEGKLEQIEDFKLFCYLLLAKSPQKEDLFKQAFSELVEPQLQAIAQLKPRETPESDTPVSPQPPEPIEPVKPPQIPPVTPPINGQKKKQELTVGQKLVEVHFGSVQPPTLPDKPELVGDSHHFQLTPRLPMGFTIKSAWKQQKHS